jgi:hypothetical protein
MNVLSVTHCEMAKCLFGRWTKACGCYNLLGFNSYKTTLSFIKWITFMLRLKGPIISMLLCINKGRVQPISQAKSPSLDAPDHPSVAQGMGFYPLTVPLY